MNDAIAILELHNRQENYDIALAKIVPKPDPNPLFNFVAPKDRPRGAAPSEIEVMQKLKNEDKALDSLFAIYEPQLEYAYVRFTRPDTQIKINIPQEIEFTGGGGSQRKFQLVSAILYIGNDTSGHYTNASKWGDTWYYFNDSHLPTSDFDENLYQQYDSNRLLNPVALLYEEVEPEQQGGTPASKAVAMLAGLGVCVVSALLSGS